MPRRSWWLTILALFLPFSVNALTGAVFHDKNSNQIRDAGEPGIPNVAVSNGRDVVLTNSEGVFDIPTPPRKEGFVFVIKPRDWNVPANELQLPKFHRRRFEKLDFPLSQRSEPDAFNVLVTADPQVNNEQEIDYYDKAIAAPLSRTKNKPAFGVTLGDIVNDQFDLFDKINVATAKIGIPFYNLNGNHDVDLTTDPQKAVTAFESVYGPATYAFHYAKVLFIALDDIRPLGPGKYVGGLTDDQLTFIENLLRVAPADARVVLMAHIPFFNTDGPNSDTFRAIDRARLFKLLAHRKNVLLLTGHTHAQQHWFHGPEKWHEYNVAAACGSFWSGPPGKDGVPPAIMWDGTPPGYAVVSFQGAERYHAVYYPSLLDFEANQIGIHAPLAIKAGEPWVSFYANVYNGHDGWKIEYRIDDSPWRPLRRVQGSWDPAYAAKFVAQNAVSTPAPWRRFPDPVVCNHLWRGYFPIDLTPGNHTLTIRAADPDGRVYEADQKLTVH
ncbi:MAG TPA: calcineurin-like phosphoesterase family protein [Chthoniobacterales bacterium]